MTSKEIIRRVIRHDAPARLGWDFLDPRYQDIAGASGARFDAPDAKPYFEWGHYPELSARANGFSGETRLDAFGNVYGRFEGRTKGECVHGVLSDGWESFGAFQLPPIVETRDASELAQSDKYVLAYSPLSVFSTLRDCRHMDNALMDTLAEPEMVTMFLKKVCARMEEIVELYGKSGVDGVIMCDDWGTQTGPFISPASFRKLFKPAYRQVADMCHERDMDFILHSCGCVLPLVDDMVDAGVDCFQFDQPENSGSDLWAGQYGRKAAFYMPVDIQRILPTGDRDRIERAALNMCDVFRACGGSLIAKDYPSLADIGVKPEWAKWAMDVFAANSDL